MRQRQRTICDRGCMWFVGVALLWASVAGAGSITASSWRPFTKPNALITLGMGKAEVLLKAGPPALQEVISHGTDGTLNLSVWTYLKTGHNASTSTLTFRGNTLVRIEITLVHP